MPVADVEHGQSLIDADDAAAFKPFCNWPRYSASAGRHVEDYFIPFQRQHVGQFFCQLSADLRNAAIKVSRVLRVIEPRLVIVSVSMLMSVTVRMIVCMAVFVSMSLCLLMLVCMFVAAMSLAVSLSVLVLVRVAMTVLVFVSMLMAVSVAMIVFVLMAVTGFVAFVMT
jgi:hypothetical protein